MVFGCAVGAHPASALAAARAHEGPQDPPNGDRIEALRRVLAQPGPEARVEREAAVDSLLLMVERRAHEVLCDVLAREDAESDDLWRYVVDGLTRRWRQQRDPVFGVESPVRAEFHRLYVTNLVRVFEGETPIAAEPPRSERQRLVWESLRALSIADRRRVFESLAETSDVNLATATLFAMAGCRDLGLAPLIGRSIDAGGAPGAAARRALTMLTFVERPFPTSTAFDQWFETNRDRSYVQLAEDAARTRNAQAQRRLRELEVELIAALAANESVDWRRLGQILRGALSTDARREYLEALRDALAQKQQPGGLAEARLELADALQAELDAGLSEADVGVRLEVLARLVADGEPQVTAVVERLVDGLRSSSATIRRAALRGIANHFSVANRRAVVEVGRAALAADELEILGGVLTCLSRRSWVAPGPEPAADVEAWTALLRATFESVVVPLAHKEQGIQVLIQSTADKTRVPEAFAVLLDVADASSGLPVAVRKQALGRIRVFTDDEARAQRSVDFVVARLEDEAPDVRESAARLLRELPDTHRSKRELWTTTIVAAVGARLVRETEEAPYRAAAECLIQLAGGPEDPTNVIGKFTEAVSAYVAREPAARKPFQREVLVDALRRVGGVQGRPVAQWAKAARGLADLEARDALRFVLERHRVGSLAGQDEPEVVDAWTLVVAAGLMAPADEPWSARSDEAAEIVTAFAELERLGKLPEDGAARALRVLALAGLGQHDEVLERGGAMLADQASPLPADRRAEVALAIAGAHLAKRQLVEAAGALDQAAADSAKTRAMRTELARLHLARSEFARADDIMRQVLAATPEDAQPFAERFLVAAEARYRRAPKANGPAVLTELRAKAGVFRRESTPESMRSRWAELVAEIERGEG